MTGIRRSALIASALTAMFILPVPAQEAVARIAGKAAAAEAQTTASAQAAGA